MKVSLRLQMPLETAARSSRWKFAILLLIGSVLMHGQGAFAHHSFAAVYDPADEVSVMGTVTKVKWVNPHAVVYLDAKGADGKVVSWEFEMHSPNSMTRAGWRRDSVKPGDVVTVKGYRARGHLNRAFIGVVVFPDGREVLKLNFDEE